MGNKYWKKIGVVKITNDQVTAEQKRYLPFLKYVIKKKQEEYRVEFYTKERIEGRFNNRGYEDDIGVRSYGKTKEQSFWKITEDSSKEALIMMDKLLILKEVEKDG